jgi:hypothetical protein
MNKASFATKSVLCLRFGTHSHSASGISNADSGVAVIETTAEADFATKRQASADVNTNRCRKTPIVR